MSKNLKVLVAYPSDELSRNLQVYIAETMIKTNQRITISQFIIEAITEKLKKERNNT